MILGTIEETEYRAMEGLSQSELSWMKKSPAHYFKRKELQKETEAMKFGTIFHAAILEPRRFLDSYVVEPTEITIDGKKCEVNKRMKAHRDYLSSWRLENVGKFILTTKQYDNLIGMATSVATEVKTNSSLKELIKMGSPEVVSVWDYRGRKCKGKADLWLPESQHGRVVVDFKKTQDASPAQFTRSIYNYSYDLQAAWYRRGFEADKVIIVAVEENYPHAIGVYDADNWLGRGDRIADDLLNKLDECEKSGHWPWYTKGIEMILPPTWLPAMESEEQLTT